MCDAGHGNDRETTVECYAGYKGGETPRTVIIAGRRLDIVEILDRKRVLDRAGGPVRNVWRCRLADGRVAILERREDGAWSVSIPD